MGDTDYPLTLDRLNAADIDTAAVAFGRCCGSKRWARAMVDSRPFAGVESMCHRADHIWWTLDPADWREAFAAHPRIGSTSSSEPVGHNASSAPDEPAESKWSRQEQARVALAPDLVRERLAAANRAYEARFGYLFIVCATGKSAEEMLASCEQRLANDPDAELRIAADEQSRITRLRLMKLTERR
jgi:2-oxo-4-hydroxy-4-carboxy-5-ureidoimidazoline decarboxylase